MYIYVLYVLLLIGGIAIIQFLYSYIGCIFFAFFEIAKYHYSKMKDSTTRGFPALPQYQVKFSNFKSLYRVQALYFRSFFPIKKKKHLFKKKK